MIEADFVRKFTNKKAKQYTNKLKVSYSVINLTLILLDLCH